MDGVESWLVALEKVTSSFSHFIIEHWVPAQAILIYLHNSTCPSCQRADGMANNGSSISKPIWSDLATPYPVPLPNSRQGEAPPIISPIPSLISNSSSGSNLPFFFVGARQRFCQHTKFLTLVFSPFSPSDCKSPRNLNPTPHPLYISFIPQLNNKQWHYYALSPPFSLFSILTVQLLIKGNVLDYTRQGF